MNGTTVDIVFVPFDSGDIENTVLVLAEEHSDALEAGVFNYNIDIGSAQNTSTLQGLSTWRMA